jgi:hypothetical protein
VDYTGKSLNQLFETLADWTTYLEQHSPDVYSAARMVDLKLTKLTPHYNEPATS